MMARAPSGLAAVVVERAVSVTSEVRPSKAGESAGASLPRGRMRPVCHIRDVTRPWVQVWDRRASVQEIELAGAITTLWRAAGSKRTVADVMIAALVQAAEASLADTGPSSAPLQRCAKALAAYRSRRSPTQAASPGV